MPPAARASDMHTCPAFTGPIPHVGGPIIPPCEPTVLIGDLPAARVTDEAICVPAIDIIVKGSETVFIGSLPAARMGDNTAHGGVIVMGCPTVILGDSGSGSQSNAMSDAKKSASPFVQDCGCNAAGGGSGGGGSGD